MVIFLLGQRRCTHSRVGVERTRSPLVLRRRKTVFALFTLHLFTLLFSDFLVGFLFPFSYFFFLLLTRLCLRVASRCVKSAAKMRVKGVNLRWAKSHGQSTFVLEVERSVLQKMLELFVQHILEHMYIFQNWCKQVNC